MPDVEALKQLEVEQFHMGLFGKSPETWPSSLLPCEAANDHVMKVEETIDLKGRGYELEVRVCKKCPLAFTYPVLTKKKKGK